MTGWAISSASATPAILTMTYKSQLQLLFHPAAFQQGSDVTAPEQAESLNAPIRLTYVGDEAHSRGTLTTTRRFFVQLLQATCQGLPQCRTRISDLLSLISTGWDTAETIAESERRLHIETPTTAKIVSDEQLDVESNILLTKVRTKVRVSFAIKPSLAADLQWSFSIKPQVTVVYGEEYDEKNMTKFLRAHDGDAMDGWDEAVRKLREKLVARGPKGSRK
jgi:kinetochore protein Spc7/SPC105